VQPPVHAPPRTHISRNPQGKREISGVSCLQRRFGRLQRCRPVCVSV